MSQFPHNEPDGSPPDDYYFEDEPADPDDYPDDPLNEVGDDE